MSDAKKTRESTVVSLDLEHGDVSLNVVVHAEALLPFVELALQIRHDHREALEKTGGRLTDVVLKMHLDMANEALTASGIMQAIRGSGSSSAEQSPPTRGNLDLED